MTSRNRETVPEQLAEVQPISDEPTWPRLTEQFLADFPSPITAQRYRTDLRRLFTAGGWAHPHEMTAEAVIAHCTAPRQDGQPTANNSIRQRVVSIRSFLVWCRDQGIPTPNVTRALDRIRTAYPRQLGKVQGAYPAARLTTAQLQSLYDACQDGTTIGHRDELAIRLLALGLRQTAVRTITWQAIDQPDGAIRVLDKGHKVHTVWPGPKLRDQLSAWRTYYDETIDGGSVAHAQVLTNYDPRRRAPAAGMTHTCLQHICATRARKAGLPHVAPHDLRRTLARIMHDTTTPEGSPRYRLHEIADALGHSPQSLSVTQAAYIGPLDSQTGRQAGGLVD